VRLSLLSRLFSRQKPQPATGMAGGGSATLRGDLGGAPSLRNAAYPPPKTRVAPAALDAPPMVSDSETLATRPSIGGPSGLIATKPSARSAEDEVVKATKMAPQEELSIKISEGLKNLSTVLGAIDEKLAMQTRTGELVAERLQSLPRVLEGLVDAERNNLETLQALRASLEKQGDAARQTSEKLDQLPTVVDGLGARIQAQTEASAAVKTSVESVGQSMRGLVDTSQRTQNSLITEFRRGQDEQRQRFEELVDRQRRTTLIVGGMLLVVVVGLILVLTRIPAH